MAEPGNTRSPRTLRSLVGSRTSVDDPLRSVVRSWSLRRVLKYSGHPTADLVGRASANTVNRELTSLDAQKRYSSNCGNLNSRGRNTRTSTGVSFAVGMCSTSFARGRNYHVATPIYGTLGGFDQFVATVRATRSAIGDRSTSNSSPSWRWLTPGVLCRI